MLFFLGKYHDLECQLIQEFTSAQRRGEVSRMREVAAVLLHFKVNGKIFTYDQLRGSEDFIFYVPQFPLLLHKYITE